MMIVLFMVALAISLSSTTTLIRPVDGVEFPQLRRSSNNNNNKNKNNNNNNNADLVDTSTNAEPKESNQIEAENIDHTDDRKLTNIFTHGGGNGKGGSKGGYNPICPLPPIVVWPPPGQGKGAPVPRPRPPPGKGTGAYPRPRPRPISCMARCRRMRGRKRKRCMKQCNRKNRRPRPKMKKRRRKKKKGGRNPCGNGPCGRDPPCGQDPCYQNPCFAEPCCLPCGGQPPPICRDIGICFKPCPVQYGLVDDCQQQQYFCHCDETFCGQVCNPLQYPLFTDLFCHKHYPPNKLQFCLQYVNIGCGCGGKVPEVSNSPSKIPSASPSANPSSSPSSQPSSSPSSKPSSSPTSTPSSSPSTDPSASPSSFPSTTPSTSPSKSPSSIPSSSPSSTPSSSPSLDPSTSPSEGPSAEPSVRPSLRPSESPSDSPSESPSEIPSQAPSNSPSSFPSSYPSDGPSESPSGSPSQSPSDMPSQSPSISPSDTPSSSPSSQPSEGPSETPSSIPSKTPTVCEKIDFLPIEYTGGTCATVDDPSFLVDCNDIVVGFPCTSGGGLSAFVVLEDGSEAVFSFAGSSAVIPGPFLSDTINIKIECGIPDQIPPLRIEIQTMTISVCKDNNITIGDVFGALTVTCGAPGYPCCPDCLHLPDDNNTDGCTDGPGPSRYCELNARLAFNETYDVCFVQKRIMRLLEGEEYNPSSEEAFEIVRKLGGNLNAVMAERNGLVSDSQSELLIRFADEYLSVESDADSDTVKLDASQLEAIIGLDGARELYRFFRANTNDSPVTQIWIRRLDGTNGSAYLELHKDPSHILKITLKESFEGGETIVVDKNGVRKLSIGQGSGIVHSDELVHGLLPHRGIKYVLYLIGDTKIPNAKDMTANSLKH